MKVGSSTEEWVTCTLKILSKINRKEGVKEMHEISKPTNTHIQRDG
jgi:hypothetical protein